MGLLNKVFFKIGLYSASNPGTACFFAVMLTFVCSMGFINYRVTVNHFIFPLNTFTYRAILKSFGSLQPLEPTSNKIISTSNLALSSELIPSLSVLSTTKTLMKISFKNHT